MAIKTVTILGVGLIGGSFGLALKKYGFRGRILGVSSERTIQAAIEKKAIDQGRTLDEGVAQADLVFLAQPIGRILDLLPQVRRSAAPHALVTDVGSTKQKIAERAAELFSGGPWFLGGHPMAGKQQRGVERADPDLFQNATYALTPPGDRLPESEVTTEFLAWIGKIGAKQLVLTPETHDAIVTWTSHLPQLLSTALGTTLQAQIKDPAHLQVAGLGLRDMTRLAESPFAIWKDIIDSNQGNLDAALASCIAELEKIRERLGDPALEEQFEAARELRRKLNSQSG
jgi:prephenate dehydrogenase